MKISYDRPTERSSGIAFSSCLISKTTRVRLDIERARFKRVPRVVLTRAITGTSSHALLPALRAHSDRLKGLEERGQGIDRVLRRETRWRERREKRRTRKW